MQSPLGPIFNALMTNATLTHLRIERVPSEDVRVNCILLLDVLKQNSTLNYVQWFICDGGDFSVDEKRRISEQTEHLLDLNRWGRKSAQDPQTTLAEFVRLLRQDYLMRSYSDDDRLSLQYGLLHCAVSKWAK